MVLQLISQYNISHFGVGAKIIETYEQHTIDFTQQPQPRLRTVLTTGSPLTPPSFDTIHKRINPNVAIQSIYGGTDIISCFALGNPLRPVYRGELQGAGLGMDVAIFDANGSAVLDQPGELICRSPFPSMPVGFLHDPDDKRYKATYFSKFDNVWTHGDYASMNAHGGLVIYGRSDTTLNPGGIRIGTAEIYRPLEHLHMIQDALAIGLPTPAGEKIILFVQLEPQHSLSPELIKLIRQQIRQSTSPAHVPALIIQAPEVPRTINSKLSELTVKRILMGEDITNRSALANPECLDYFYQLATTELNL